MQGGWAREGNASLVPSSVKGGRSVRDMTPPECSCGGVHKGYASHASHEPRSHHQQECVTICMSFKLELVSSSN